MVLVSHIYKFIYLKNFKVAGSSVESFFGQFCINPAEKYLYSFEDTQDEQITEFGILGSRNNGKVTIWYNHKLGVEVKKDLGALIFNNYFKFCVVRNPYDTVVSIYFWSKANLKYTFKEFCKKFRHDTTSSYIDRIFIDGKPICQFYIRYENLVEDIITVLGKLGIKDYNINDLPKHKTDTNPHNKHYREYYDEESKEYIRKCYQNEIKMFGYEF